MNTARRSRHPSGARLCPPRTSRSGPETSDAPVGIGGVPCGQPAAAGAPCTQPRSGENPRSPRLFCRCPAPGRRTKNCRQRFAPRPGGTPQEISRGQARAAGAAPGWAAKRAMPQRGIEEVFDGIFTAAFPPPLVATGHFLRCPAGARSHAARSPGAASAGADLPPANLLRRPSGTRTAADLSLSQFPCPKFPCPIQPPSRPAASCPTRWGSSVRAWGLPIGSFPLCVPSDLCGVFRKRSDRGDAEWNTAEIGRNAERERADAHELASFRPERRPTKWGRSSKFKAQSSREGPSSNYQAQRPLAARLSISHHPTHPLRTATPHGFPCTDPKPKCSRPFVACPLFLPLSIEL